MKIIWKTNTSNILTMIRLLLAISIAIAFIVWLYKPQVKIWIPIIVMYLLGLVTDFFDGFLARKNNLVTDFGKFMDPIADKALVTSALLVVLSITSISRHVKAIPVIFGSIVIMLIRDIFVDSIKVYLSLLKDVKFASSKWGTLKTWVYHLAILLTLTGIAFPQAKIKTDYIIIVYIIAACLSLYSAALYMQQLKKLND